MAKEITLLQEEVIPAIRQYLTRVDELDERLLAEQELLHRCQLVVAGKDQAADLLFLVSLRDAIAADDLQPAVALPHLLPEIGGAMTRHHRVAGTAVGAAGIGALVEGQELGAGPLQACGHLHFAVADGEVHQGAAEIGRAHV